MSNKVTVDLTLKTKDTFPAIVARFQDEKGQIDLSTAERVEIYLSLEEAEPPHVIEGKCTVTPTEEEINGVMTKVWLVSYVFLATDTAVPGLYRAEHKITWSPGVVESVPNEGYKLVEIEESL